ncbi:FAM210 family protein [Myxococcus sp. K15C18031901]|uniref:FAM210 family protein n=1 Tax=Myxococcus dinghuensis TaxID=2906761 RepID=UPI0020A7BFCF|nr:FAM210 family protein [Myxococcus dinghuensis]MCP3099030.1 FAM210 family protein [Myxococcus dinghuensis]
MNPSVSDTPPPAPTSTAKAEKPSLMARFKNLLLEYGPLAFVVHYAIFGLVLGGFYVAIKLGFRPESTGAQAGTWAAAYALTQVVKPLRLAAVFLLTPLVARIPPIHRFIERNKHKWSM